MYKPKIKLGVMPTKRDFLSMQEAVRQKDRMLEAIQNIRSDIVTLVTLEDICENGIAFQKEKVPEIINHFKKEEIDALFIPFCDFGEETVIAPVAAAFQVPVLVWGARDERPNTDAERGRDTQCGMFAATKVLQRYGVHFSYIYSEPADSITFREGYLNFIRTVAVVQRLHGMRIGKIGERPGSFVSVMANESGLMKDLGITTVVISPLAVKKEQDRILKEQDTEYKEALADLQKRFDVTAAAPELIQKTVAAKLAIRNQITANNCSAAAIECWSGCEAILGTPVCTAIGELANEGIPVSCEADVNGAVTMAILDAAMLGDEPSFLADLTIRHPENDNAELLWHCGPFPYALKAPEEKARITLGQERFALKEGKLTVARFDEIDGKFVLFAGEGQTTMGPETTGTYVWFETDDWKKWEEHLMFGPYIHHLGGAYGELSKVLYEAAYYLDIAFDTVDHVSRRSLS